MRPVKNEACDGSVHDEGEKAFWYRTPSAAMESMCGDVRRR
jgi:hypothetical protein